MWQDVLALDDLPLGSQLCLTVSGYKLLLVRTDQGIYALENRCPHAAFPLQGGEIKDNVIRCPTHGAKFDLSNGEPLPGFRLQAVPTYPVQISGERVLVNVEEQEQ